MVASVTGHPLLHCGYNSTTNNEDELDGAGVNESVWPVLFDSFESLAPLIITEAMLAQFDGCADLTVPAVNDVFMIPYELDTLVVRGRR